MKKNMLLLVVGLIVITTLHVFAQSGFNNLRNAIRIKDFVEAEKYINEAINERQQDKEVFLMAGEVYTELQNFQKALDMFKAAYDIDSKDPVVISKYGVAMSNNNMHESAIEFLTKATKKYSDNVYILLALGQAYISNNNLDQAALQITKAREKNKTMAEPYVALGDLYYAQDVYELAKNNYEEALKIDNDLTNARIKLATSYYKMANREYDKDLSNELFNRSLKEWNIITQKDPRYARAWWEQGRILFFGKRFDLAAGSFLKYLELRADHSIARWYLAQSYVEIGLCDSAQSHLRQVAVEIDSVKYKAGLILAQCLFEKGNYAESLTEFEAVKPNMEMDIKDIERMAAAALKIGDTTKTIAYYKEVIDINPNQCNLMYQLANLTIFMKNYEDAIYFLDKRNVNCTDNLSRVYYLLGNCWFNLDKSDTAVVLLNKSIELDPKNLQARLYLADVQVSLANKDAARRDFQLVIDMGLADTATYRREITQAYSKLCNLLLDLKLYKDMNSVSKKWIEFDANSEYAWLYNGISFQGLSDKENSCRSYKRGLSINPQNNFLKKQVKALECN